MEITVNKRRCIKTWKQYLRQKDIQRVLYSRAVLGRKRSAFRFWRMHTQATLANQHRITAYQVDTTILATARGVAR